MKMSLKISIEIFSKFGQKCNFPMDKKGEKTVVFNLLKISGLLFLPVRPKNTKTSEMGG